MSKTYETGKPCKYGHIAPRNKRNGTCSECSRIRLNAYYLKNKEALNKIRKARYKQNPEPVKQMVRKAWRQRNNLQEPTRPEPEVCECCGGTTVNKAIVFDHCHKTKKFRGWLCSKCNTGIGILGDDVEGLERALTYLKRFQP